MAAQTGQLYGVARTVLTPVFRFCWRVDIEGLDHVPVTGSAILAPNHISVLDSFFVPLVLPRRITYVGKAEYMDDWKTRFLFPAMGMIPIDRSGGDSSRRALDAAAGILNAGQLFGIYPEGTRSRSGNLHKGHTGVARLALETNSPIIPVGLVGTDVVQPPDAKFPKPFRTVSVKFGKPIEVGRYRNRADDRLLLRQITDEVMYEIRGLTGQEYVDTYATKRAPANTNEVTEQEEMIEGAVADPSGTAAHDHGEPTGVDTVSENEKAVEPERLPTKIRVSTAALLGGSKEAGPTVPKRKASSLLAERTVAAEPQSTADLLPGLSAIHPNQP